MAGGVFASAAPARPGPNPVTVAVIDTGIDPSHPEFDYRGATNRDDQLVGWWDFSADAENHEPAQGQTWDPMVPIPYDTHGHGTATASMVAGRNVNSRKSPSAFPGARLAIAKVGSGESGSQITGDLGAAIEWAVDTIGADVISMSIGSSVPFFASANLHDAIAAAREEGVLVVVSNGNGYLNAGIPGEPGLIKGYGDSPAALAVGAAGTGGLQATTDPEVVAEWSPIAATPGGGYRKITGTSFSAPFVAGFAARLVQEARSHGRELGADDLEDLVKFVARDTAAPPNLEGYGVIDLSLLPGALGHARSGTAPAANPVNDAYNKAVRNTVTKATRG
jgi:serine protease AprX